MATMKREAGSQQLTAAVARARAHSPFLAGLLDRHADISELLLQGLLDEALLAAPAAPGTDVATALRLQRGRAALALAIGDLAGVVPLERLTRELSDLADHALDRALAAAIEERTPGEAPRGFAIIALGKHGSRELNYSSDIDLIYLFDPKILPRRSREEPGQAAIRIGQRVAELLQKRDANGYVF